MEYFYSCNYPYFFTTTKEFCLRCARAQLKLNLNKCDIFITLAENPQHNKPSVHVLQNYILPYVYISKPVPPKTNLVK